MLSVEKLDALLETKEMVIVEYLLVDGTISYLDILSTTTGDRFYLYIPSKYIFEMPKNRGPSYSIDFIDEPNIDEDIVNQYTNDTMNHKIITPNLEYNGDSRMFADKLAECYNRPSSMKLQGARDENQKIKDMYRHLKRFKPCVESSKYKVAIRYGNHICAIGRHNDLQVMKIKNYPYKGSFKMYITTTLEVIYEEMESVLKNISSIKAGIYQIMDQNYSSHESNMRRLMEEKTSVDGRTDMLYRSHIEYDKKLSRLYEMLDALNDHPASPPVTEQKTSILRMISEVETLRENSTLVLDQILFDNQVMLHQIFNNFQKINSP
jgi:hypothetical protein